MTAPASPSSDLMRLAREALQSLTSQGVPPVPTNYEHHFLQAARRNGMPEQLLDRLKIPRGAGVEDLPDVDRTVSAVLELVLRVGIADEEIPSAIRSLFRRVLKLARTNRLEKREKEVLAALQSAARRSLSGQFDFDPDELLRSPTPVPGGTAGGEVSGPTTLKVLRLTLRVVVAQGRRPGNVGQSLAKILKIVESDRLHEKGTEVLSHLQKLAKTEGGDRALTGVDKGAGTSEGNVELEQRADALSAACISLLELMQPALIHSDRDLDMIQGMIKSLRSDTDQSQAIAKGAQKLNDRLTRYFQSIPEQRKQVKDLIGVVMTTLRTASRGSDDFAERLSGFSSQVEKAENPEDILAVKEAILQESKALSTDIATMKEKFDDVNDTVRKAHAQIAKLQNELVKTKSLSLIDPLTGVPNRRGFDDWVERVLRTGEDGHVPFSFMVFDIDHFKRVNDTYGHMAGDQVLREVSGRIVKAVRDGDFVSRFGGEEFCVALPGGNLKEAIRVADRILTSIRQTPIDIGTSAITITSSVGVSEYRDGESMEDVFERSDRALYMAKETGRNKCCTEVDLDNDAESAAA